MSVRLHCLTTVALLGIATLSVAASIDSELLQTLQNAPRDQLLSIYLCLEAQFDQDPSGLRADTEPNVHKQSEVIRTRQQFSATTQKSLLDDLRLLQGQGLVTQIRSFWINNLVAVQICVGELEPLLHRHPEIARVGGAGSRDQSDKGAPAHFVKGDALDEISWGVEDIQAPPVWNLGFRGQGVVIGFIGTGVDYTHPDLANRVWVNPGEDLNGNGIVDSSDWNHLDDDQNGYVDDLRGWNFVLNSPEVMDQHLEGTADAGILVGEGCGGQQTGVAPEAQVMILKAYLGTQVDFWEAQQYALQMGADLIVSSLYFGWNNNPPPDYAILRANSETILAAGLIQVNSIGATGGLPTQFPVPFNVCAPANCPPPWLHEEQPQTGGLSALIGAGAYGSDHQIRSYSSRGPSAWSLNNILALNPNYPYALSWLVQYNDYPYQSGGLIKPDLAAPTAVTTTSLGGGYLTIYDQISAASSHLGGALALLLSADPQASPDTLCRVLLETAIDSGPPGLDTLWGAGRLDVYAALLQLLQEISATLTGVVQDSSTNLPLAGAAVEFMGTTLSSLTDSVGHYLLVNIPPGTYDVRFSAAGHDTLILPNIDLNVNQVESLCVALTGPHVLVNVQEIEQTLLWGQTIQIPLEVQNTGSSDLNVVFSKRGDWEPFSLYSTIQAQSITGDDKLFGVEAAGGSLWISGGNGNSEPNRLYRFSFSGAPLQTFNQPASTSALGWRDLAWDGQLLYGSSGTTVEGVDLNALLQVTFTGPLALNRALAYDSTSDHFFTADNTTDIIEFTRSGAVVRSWTHNLHIQGLAWHPQEEDNCPLYIFSQDGPELLRLSKLNPDSGVILFVTDLEGGANEQAGGAAISGDLDPNRWCFIGLVQGPSDRVEVRSLGAYAPWLTVEPSAQTIPPGGTLEATVLLNAGVVPTGSYQIDLVIEHNAAEPDIVIPVTLHVQPAGVGESSPHLLPTSFSVGSVYPNPFNAETVIPLELPQRSQVKIELFNLRGQNLGMIFEGVQNAGYPKIRYNATHLPSGMYFCRITAEGLERGGKYQDTGKLLLLK